MRDAFCIVKNFLLYLPASGVVLSNETMNPT